MKKILGLVFLVAWVAGEAPRLWWKEAVPVRPMDAAAGILAAAEILRVIKEKGGIRRIRGVEIIAAILVGSWILGPYPVRTLVYWWLIWRGEKIFGDVRKWIRPAMAAFLILGLGQYVFLPDMRFLLQYGWDEHYYRLIGTVLDPNYFGVMAGMILLSSLRVSHWLSRWRKFARSPSPSLALGQAPRWRSGWPQTAAVSLANLPTSIAASVRNLRKINSLLFLLAFITLVLTFSRASWLAFGLGFWIWFGPGTTLTCSRGLRPRVARARVRGSGVPADFSDEKSGYVRRRLGRLGILGILGVLGLGVWWAAPKPGGEGVNLMRTSSIEQRWVSWNQAIEAWKQHPWVGIGSWEYGVGNAPSSSWLLILEATGIMGLGILGSLGILVIREIRGDRFWMAMAIMVGVHAIFNNTLFYPPVLGLLAMMRVMDSK